MRSANQQQIPHNLPGQSARNAANYQSLGRRAELGIYAKLFPWICIAAAIVTGAPALILDPDSGIYSQKLAISSGFAALVTLLVGLGAMYFLSADQDQDAKPQIVLGVLLIGLLGANNALLVVETNDPRNAWVPVLGMICVGLTYPRIIGALIITLPQLGLVTWLASSANWESSWNFGFFLTFGGAMIALIIFYLRKAYFHHHHSLLLERTSFITALRHESAERTLLQERLLTERHLTTLGRLAGGVAHDLNNILVPIMGNAAMLEESVHSSTHKRQAKEILHAATRARTVTQQLDFFAARGKDKFETLDLNLLLSELSPIVWRTFPQGIDIDLNVQDKPIYLRASRLVLQDLITNLLLDAGNAAAPGSSVTLSLALNEVLPDNFAPQPERTFCAITISDGAEPMSADQRKTVFDHDHIGDRGIGLLGARDKAEALGGFLDLAVTSEGGNQFRLFLPIQEAEETDTKSGDPHISAAVAPEVLVVDDEASVRGVTSQLLKRAGFVVRECDSGEAALEEIASHLPDAIVMDLRMPGIGGRAATENIREQNPSLPIVICTGYTGDAEGWLTALPNCALLQKPYDTHDLIKTVNSLLNSEFAGG